MMHYTTGLLDFAHVQHTV